MLAKEQRCFWIYSSSTLRATHSEFIRKLHSRDKKIDFIWALRFLQSVFDLSLKRLPPIASVGFNLSSLWLPIVFFVSKGRNVSPHLFLCMASLWLQCCFNLASLRKEEGIQRWIYVDSRLNQRLIDVRDTK